MIVYRDLHQDTIFRADTVTLGNYYIANQTSDLGILTQLEEDFAEGDTLNANSQLSSYIPTSNIQTNYKQFFDLYSAYNANGSLNSTQMAQLEVLAQKCPQFDGLVVYNARVLFDLINQVFAPYNDYNCEAYASSLYEGGGNEEGRIRRINPKSDNPKLISKYEVYPNPTNSELKIFSEKENEKVKIQIKDLMNKIILESEVEIINHSANFSFNLINGMYFLTLTNSELHCEIIKIVVTK